LIGGLDDYNIATLGGSIDSLYSEFQEISTLTKGTGGKRYQDKISAVSIRGFVDSTKSPVDDDYLSGGIFQSIWSL